MEDPPLEKVIGSLKKAEIERWEVEGDDFDTKYLSSRPKFKIKLNGINFEVRTCSKSGEFTTKYYYALYIGDWNKKYEICYDNRKDSIQQKQLKDFYEYLLPILRTREEEREDKEKSEFKKAIDEILSN